MAEASASEVAKPKKHSAFVQTVFRKSGETLDLGGKALIGISGLGPALKGGLAHIDSALLLTAISGGSVAIAAGIYLQAKAEETE